MNINDLTYGELNSILKELGIEGLSQEETDKLERDWTEEMPDEFRESLNKMAMLLISISREHKSDPKVYSFDTEAYDVDAMYEILFKGIESISNGELAFSDVVQENVWEDEDEEEDDYTWLLEGRDGKVSFNLNGESYETTLKFRTDWYDCTILNVLNQILDEKGNGRKIFFMPDGYQEIILFYCDAEWAERFVEKTGCRLYNRMK